MEAGVSELRDGYWTIILPNATPSSPITIGSTMRRLFLPSTTTQVVTSSYLPCWIASNDTGAYPRKLPQFLLTSYILSPILVEATSKSSDSRLNFVVFWLCIPSRTKAHPAVQMLEANEDMMGAQAVLGLASGDHVTLPRGQLVVPFKLVSRYHPLISISLSDQIYSSRAVLSSSMTTIGRLSCLRTTYTVRAMYRLDESILQTHENAPPLESAVHRNGS
jgi:hypothetical protein